MSQTLTDAPPARSTGNAVRLSVMMFLQYAVWGVWLPYLANYLVSPVDRGGLGFTGGQVGWILGLAGSIGALAAPFIAGQIADRYLNAERALAILLLVGGAVKYVTAYTHGYMPFLLLSILYSVAYMPTLALTNSISLQNLPDRERQFPRVRLWGTVGWIVASSAFTMLWLNTTDPVTNTRRIADALKVAGVISVAYALYALLLLPRTPPQRNAPEPLAFARAFGLLRHAGFLVVTLVALPISMIHQAYFIRISPYLEQDTGLSLSWIGPALSIGQVSELVFLIFLGLLIKQLGYKWVLVLGALAYAVRFAIFATFHAPAPVLFAQALHGLCYGCFFAGAYLYIDRVAPPDVRHSAQTVFGIVILGLGPVLSGFYNQYFDRFTTVRVIDGVSRQMQSYDRFWWAQAGLAVLSTVVLVVAFREHDREQAPRAFEVGQTA